MPVRAGGSSRKIKADCGISDIVVSSNLDIHFEAVVQGGSLHLKFIGPQFKRKPVSGLLKEKGIKQTSDMGVAWSTTERKKSVASLTMLWSAGLAGCSQMIR